MSINILPSIATSDSNTCALSLANVACKFSGYFSIPSRFPFVFMSIHILLHFIIICEMATATGCCDDCVHILTSFFPTHPFSLRFLLYWSKAVFTLTSPCVCPFLLYRIVSSCSYSLHTFYPSFFPIASESDSFDDISCACNACVRHYRRTLYSREFLDTPEVLK